MAGNRDLAQFMRGALSSGKSRVEIAAVLGQAGWSAQEVSEALEGWADVPFAPPVPRPRPVVTARDFFVYALMFGALLFGAGYLVGLLHALIDHFLSSEGSGATYRIRWAMAVLIVTLPLYLWLATRENRRLAADPALARSAIRSWMTYVTLLFAAAVLLGDLVAVIYAFLSGDLTVQFALKALVVAGIAGGIFGYYRRDGRQGATG
ncbi:DUF5671 domain-containing protein [Sulfitobacter dubius]|uniref:DUF5671 domain-containing protein n=1 Tax=Sulfitobacter dubius TaxID=218673 RepID=UPI0022AE8FA0|nr:DUF5671 domain-containing protein [Sulfitobacter dubius]MCZ4367664.1 DUF5671 domain-containing protein [Sulfitobacter dubius]